MRIVLVVLDVPVGEPHHRMVVFLPQSEFRRPLPDGWGRYAKPEGDIRVTLGGIMGLYILILLPCELLSPYIAAPETHVHDLQPHGLVTDTEMDGHVIEAHGRDIVPYPLEILLFPQDIGDLSVLVVSQAHSFSG